MEFHLIKLGESTFLVEECKDFSEGLSKRKHLLDNEGMLFNFNVGGFRSFHMKDCHLPLDIIFIENGVIKKIFHNCPPCKAGEECINYECDSSDIVIEVLGGTCKANQINEGLIYRHF